MRETLKNNRKMPFILFAGLLWVSLLGMACNLPGMIVESIDRPLEGEAPAFTESPSATDEVVSIPTTPPQLSSETCLPGAWEISDIHEYVLAAVPPEMAQEYDLTYTGTNGSAYFVLSPDGEARMVADDLELLFEASAAIFTVPVTARVDGEAVGSYTATSSDATSGTLTTSGMDTGNLTASAEAMGQQLMSADQIFRAIPLLQPPANQADYVCSGNTLQLKISAYPDDVPPLVFTRRQ